MAKISNHILSLFIIILLVLGCVPSLSASDEQQKVKTIRVGYPIQSGLTEIDKNGNYSGYTYDYLEEIAQYTGWNYEFIQLSGDLDTTITEMLEMLEAGKIDLMTGIVFNEKMAQRYDYAGQSYGTGNTVLNVLYDNTSINKNNYLSLPLLRVAVIETAQTRKKELIQFCEMNNINYEIVLCETEDDQLKALHTDKADAMLSIDVNLYSGVRTIAKFSPKPFYFITTKGNKEIVQQLNSAILSIEEVDPYFSTTLYEKYFSSQKQDFLLSDDDMEYIHKSPILKVGVLQDLPPFQYENKKTKQMDGIAIGLLDTISQKTGLKFELVSVSDIKVMKEKLSTGELQLAAGLHYDYINARELQVLLTKPYVSAQYIMLLNSNLDEEENMAGKRLALPNDTWYRGSYFIGQVQWYNTFEECVDAVNSGEADYTYGNSYSIQYYMNNPKYKNIKLIPQTYEPYEVCYGISRNEGKSLLSIFNKVLLSMSDEDFQTIIFQNTKFRPDYNIFYFIEGNPIEVIVIIIIIAVFIISILLWTLHLRTKLNRKKTMDIKKHYQLYELTNERFFEYDVEKSLIMVSLNNGKDYSDIQTLDFSKKQEEDTHWEDKLYFFEVIRSRKDGVSDVQYKLPNGQYKWMRFTTRSIFDESGKLAFIIGKFSDIDHEKREKEVLTEQAHKDGLTNLYNIIMCKTLIQNDLDAFGEKQAALLIADVDHFKSINDQYGHYIGDEVLSAVAKTIAALFPDDITGRLGGDEFIIYLKNVKEKQELIEKCTSLCEAVRLIHPNHKEESVTVSIGAVLFKNCLFYNELYQLADSALYETKNNGRNGFSVQEMAKN